MKNNEVEFVPSGLAACFINNIEVRLLAMSLDGIKIRISQKLTRVLCLKICFYQFKNYAYEEVQVEDFSIICEERESFCYKYKILIKDKAYSRRAADIVQDYSTYAVLKNYGYENEFSEHMVSYPAEKDVEFFNIYQEQKKAWMNGFVYPDFTQKFLEDIELAIEINNDYLYEKFIHNSAEEFQKQYLQENYAYDYLWFHKNISRIYIGNEFCHNLFPSYSTLFKLLNKAYNEKLNITVCFTYMTQGCINKYKDILEKVFNWCVINDFKIEIVINDWGMIDLCRGKSHYFQLNLGILLNKRKKDPRYVYKKGYEENKELICENSLNGRDFRLFLKEYKINRYEYESCGYKIKIPEGNHSLHMPFYITNTSQYCTLYAMCRNSNRGKQIFVKECPKYCTDYMFSYPKHLKMVGRYNSLFAFDEIILRDSSILKEYLKKGIDRIVLNYI